CGKGKVPRANLMIWWGGHFTMKYFSEPAAVIRSSRLTRATALTPAAGAGIRPQVSSSNGKARCLRGGTRKFCRRGAVMNRSRPLSSPWPPRNCFWNCCAAAALRIWAKRSAVGTYIRNCSLNCLLPAGTSVPPGPGKVRKAGTSMLSRPGPSARMCSGRHDAVHQRLREPAEVRQPVGHREDEQARRASRVAGLDDGQGIGERRLVITGRRAVQHDRKEQGVDRRE